MSNIVGNILLVLEFFLLLLNIRYCVLKRIFIHNLVVEISVQLTQALSQIENLGILKVSRCHTFLELNHTFRFACIVQTISKLKQALDHAWQQGIKVMTKGYRAFSFTYPASVQIYQNKRKCLHKKRVQLPQDWFEQPTWPPFHCFGIPISPP